jgi:hypothetical protein
MSTAPSTCDLVRELARRSHRNARAVELLDTPIEGWDTIALASLAGERLGELHALLNTPETEDFDVAVPLEAAHQVLRWGVQNDADKSTAEWYWLIGHLAGKALYSAIAGDLTKAKHHTITAAAALRNWHAHLRGGVPA